MRADKRRARRVGIVVKRSMWQQRLEERKDPKLRALAEQQDPAILPLISSHRAHEATIVEVREAIGAAGAEVAFQHYAGESFDQDGLDLVVTVGGDGTLLAASHYVMDIPILGVNSAPNHSVGFFCGAKSGEAFTSVDRALRGTLKSTTLTRMKVTLNDRVIAARVLNDALFCHASPAATSRYIVRLGDIEEQQKSSGFWIGPAAGSTAAQRSAGGRVLPLTSKQLQLVVREPYTPSGESYQLRHAMVGPTKRLIVRSKMHDAKIFFDGPDTVVDLGFGDTIEFSQADQSLVVLGITSRRKWATEAS
jgi:NAD+ kinase